MRKKLLTVGTIAVVTFSGALFTTDYTYAQPSLQDVQKEKKEVKEKLSKAEKEIADILYEIKDVNDEVNILKDVIKSNEKEIEKREDNIKELEANINKLEDQIEERMYLLKNRISSYQDNGGTINLLEVVLGAKGFNDMISQVSAVTTITNADLELVEAIEEDKNELDGLVEEEEFQKQELEVELEMVEEQKDEYEGLLDDLEAKEKTLKKKKEKLENESSELSQLEAEIRAEMAGPTVVSNSNSNDSDSGSSGGAVPYTGTGGSAIQAGMHFANTKSYYQLGAKNPSTGTFDCSGFVQWAYEQEGISLPRTAAAMSTVGTKVSLSEAKPGDLVFFRGGGHVGIYLGGGKFLGSQTSTGVAIADMTSGYWRDTFDGNVRRIK